LVEVYKGTRIWMFITNKYFTNDEVKATFFSSMILIIATVIMDEIILVLIIVSTIICVNNFGKGLREIILKQKGVNDALPRSDNTTLDNL
jgi:hypothetical protein